MFQINFLSLFFAENLIEKRAKSFFLRLLRLISAILFDPVVI